MLHCLLRDDTNTTRDIPALRAGLYCYKAVQPVHLTLSRMISIAYAVPVCP